MNPEEIWNKFAQNNNLSQKQLNLFKRYSDLMNLWNDRANLTNITDVQDVIAYHFEDSLSIAKFINFNDIKEICDVGTGGGLPGIPLKIKYPHLNVILIEVNTKKIEFLNTVIKELGLENIEVCPLDWRTFLRKTDYSIEIFCSRASLHTDELLRVFKGGSPYNNAILVYWSSIQRKTQPEDLIYLKREEQYKVGNKIRKLMFFSK